MPDSNDTIWFFVMMHTMQYHETTIIITTLLRERGVWFETFEHEPVRTSEEAAAIRPDYTIEQGTKALIVRARVNGEKKFVMVTVPGNMRFNPKKIKEVFGLSDVRFATEEEVARITGGVQPGGVPPFGTIFSLPVYADKRIFDHEKIIFNAGDRRYSVGMFSKDYRDIVAPEVGDIAELNTPR